MKQAKTERRLSKEVELDPLLLSPIITDLMIEGLVEIVRRRTFFFFIREYCVITTDGLSALQAAKNPLDRIVGLLIQNASTILGDITSRSLFWRIVIASVKCIFRLTPLAIR